MEVMYNEQLVSFAGKRQLTMHEIADMRHWMV